MIVAEEGETRRRGKVRPTRAGPKLSGVPKGMVLQQDRPLERLVFQAPKEQARLMPANLSGKRTGDGSVSSTNVGEHGFLLSSEVKRTVCLFFYFCQGVMIVPIVYINLLKGEVIKNDRESIQF